MEKYNGKQKLRDSICRKKAGAVFGGKNELKARKCSEIYKNNIKMNVLNIKI